MGINMTLAKGRNANIAGLISSVVNGTAGTSSPVNVKSMRWALNSQREIHDVSGFGDGGDSYDDDGISKHTFNVAAYIRTDGTLGISGLSGTSTIYGTVALIADNGRVFSGTARIHIMAPTAIYGGGDEVVMITGKIQGPLSET